MGISWSGQNATTSSAAVLSCGCDAGEDDGVSVRGRTENLGKPIAVALKMIFEGRGTGKVVGKLEGHRDWRNGSQDHLAGAERVDLKLTGPRAGISGDRRKLGWPMSDWIGGCGPEAKGGGGWTVRSCFVLVHEPSRASQPPARPTSSTTTTTPWRLFLPTRSLPEAHAFCVELSSAASQRPQVEPAVAPWVISSLFFFSSVVPISSPFFSLYL